MICSALAILFNLIKAFTWIIEGLAKWLTALWTTLNWARLAVRYLEYSLVPPSASGKPGG